MTQSEPRWAYNEEKIAINLKSSEFPRVDFCQAGISDKNVPGHPFPVTSGSIGYGNILVEEHELHVKVKLRCIEKLFEIRIEE